MWDKTFLGDSMRTFRAGTPVTSPVTNRYRNHKPVLKAGNGCHKHPDCFTCPLPAGECKWHTKDGKGDMAMTPELSKQITNTLEKL